jgi:hypothetical protein
MEGRNGLRITWQLMCLSTGLPQRRSFAARERSILVVRSRERVHTVLGNAAAMATSALMIAVRPLAAPEHEAPDPRVDQRHGLVRGRLRGGVDVVARAQVLPGLELGAVHGVRLPGVVPLDPAHGLDGEHDARLEWIEPRRVRAT